MSVEVVTGELVHVEPGSLIVGANVRTDVQADAKTFARSITERGVIEPITAYRSESGELVVLRGQRRTVVATQVGTPTGTVPVQVVTAPEDADRITDQLVENLHREPMREGEVAAAVEQLSLLGVSAAQIAKRTGVERRKVDAVAKLAGAPEIRERVNNDELTLDEVAIYTEFVNDAEALERLDETRTLGEGLEHIAQELRIEREDHGRILAAIEGLRADGQPVLDAAECKGDLYRVLCENLRTPDGAQVPEDQWPSLPGAALAVQVETVWNEVTDEDGSTRTERSTEPVAHWVVPDPASAGLVYMWDVRSHNGTKPAMTAAEKEAASEERRRVIAFNKQWRAAEVVRREWLREFFARKSAPKGAEQIIAEAMLTNTYALSKAISENHGCLMDILGEDRPAYYGNREALVRFATAATPKALTMRALAVVVAAWEGRTDTHTWRNPDDWDERVMNALIDWGYAASGVERILIGEDHVMGGHDDAA